MSMLLKGTEKLYSFLLQETQEMKLMAFKTGKFCMVVIKKDFSRILSNNIVFKTQKNLHKYSLHYLVKVKQKAYLPLSLRFFRTL